VTVLKNQRWELYAQGFVAGKTIDQAYVDAGFKKNRGNAARLNAKEYITKRVAELKAKVAERAEMTAADVLKEYMRLARSNILDYVEVNGQSICFKDFEELTKDQAHAISEISERQSMAGTTLSFKLHSKTTALDALGKHFGLFQKERENDADKLSDEELEQKVKEIMKK